MEAEAQQSAGFHHCSNNITPKQMSAESQITVFWQMSPVLVKTSELIPWFSTTPALQL